ncbi:MAG: hypothetical protein C5B49_04975 [Bdellovibrio sp.]|nr:MAG: hypothetical protein C5B49_04975 [Bdellovibrio sp.]
MGVEVSKEIARLFPKYKEVRLPRAPLEVVLAQVRYESILAIQSQPNIIPFQDSIRKDYPILRPQQSQATSINAQDGSVVVIQQNIWRFLSADEKWVITLAPDFVSVETTAYPTRDLFLDKFKFAMAQVESFFGPAIVTRTGARYIDRLKSEDLAQVKDLVKPSFLGMVGMADLTNQLELSISESALSIDQYQIFSRWGLLPPNITTDPLLVKPSPEKSWLLDIDVSNSIRKPWNFEELANEFGILTEISYRFFRWATTDYFITHFGGKL